MTSIRRAPRVKMDRKQVDIEAPVNGLMAIADLLLPGLVRPGEPLNFSSLTNNSLILAPGFHGNIIVDEARSTLLFLPGAYAESIVVTKDCTIIGLVASSIRPAPGANTALVSVKGANVVFHGMTITAPPAANCLSLDATSAAIVSGGYFFKVSGAAFATIAAGGRAIFTNCIFGPIGTTVPANVDITGLVRLAAFMHINVTVVSEV
jgi:hypothetical protein